MVELELAIQNLVDDIPKEVYFDTHHIIKLLIKRYSDVYNEYASPTLPKHGNIGKILSSFETLVKRIGVSYSFNIHDNVSECTLWKRL